MVDNQDKTWLSQRFGNSVRFDEPMSKHTSFRVGGPADIWAVPETVEELTELVKWALEKQIPYRPVGGGTNLLVTDNGVKEMVFLLTQCLNQITRHRDQQYDRVTVGAGVRLSAFCRYAIKHGLSGANFALGIPGTVGGAIMMNAGTALGSMADIIESVNIYQPEKGTLTLRKDDLDFSYRSLSFQTDRDFLPFGTPIVLSGCFRLHRDDPVALKKQADEILDARKKREPGRFPSAGCFFKNPISEKTAGELIDSAGLKGRRVGGAEIAMKHANYIINRNNASAKDILALMEIVQDTVLQRFGIRLEPEVKIIGD